MSIVGYTRACGKKTSGIVTIGFIEAASFTGATKGSSSEDYSAVTLASSAYFKKYQFQEDEAELKESVKVENGVSSVTQTVTFKMPEMSSASRAAVEEIMDASYCGLVGVIIRPDGTKIIVGYSETEKTARPLRLSTAEGTTGKKMSDAQGEEVTLTRDSAEKARYYTGEESALFGA